MLIVSYLLFLPGLIFTSDSSEQDESVITGKKESFYEADNYSVFENTLPTPGYIPVLNRRIVRSMRVNILEHPYVVSIRRDMAHYLTGTMLTRNVVVSVAHPLYEVPVYDLGVVAGETYSDRGRTMFTVLMVVIHDDFEPATLRADISLLRLYEDISKRWNTRTIGLVNPSVSFHFATGFITGWGRCDTILKGTEVCLPRSNEYYPDELVDPMLRTIRFVITANNIYCSEYSKLRLNLTHGMSCYGVAREEDPVTPCLAVPGAPLVIGARLAGILSWGFGCGYVRDLPLVFSDMQIYQRWILYNVPILRKILQKNLTELYRATKAVTLLRSMNELESKGIKPPIRVGHDSIDDDSLRISPLDKLLARIQGYVYDFRDFIADRKFLGRKKHVSKVLKSQFLYKQELANISIITPTLYPFMISPLSEETGNDDLLLYDSSSEVTPSTTEDYFENFKVFRGTQKQEDVLEPDLKKI